MKLPVIYPVTFQIYVAYVTCSINLKVALRLSWPVSAILYSVMQRIHVNRARVLIGWQLPTHVCQSFTPVCQRVCRLFLCRSNTPIWVCQHECANFSLPCEGRFRYHRLNGHYWKAWIMYKDKHWLTCKGNKITYVRWRGFFHFVCLFRPVNSLS